MKSKIKACSLAIATCLLASPSVTAVEVFKNDKTSLAISGFVKGVYYKNDDNDEIDEALSVWGFNVKQNLDHGWVAGITTQWGLNFDKNTNFTVGGKSQAPAGSSDEAVFTRLGFVHLSHEKWGTIGIGKQWGAYYDVTAGSDIINYWGGHASGAYNLNSDGGVSGTGRADQAVTWRNTIGNFKIALQVQAQDEIVTIDVPDDHPFAGFNGDQVATVGNGFGASAIYNFNNFTFGLGHNVSDIEIHPDFGGTTEDDTITGFSIGYGTNGQPGLYAFLLLVTAENHELDTNGQYMDTEGSELIVKYTLDNGLSIFGGFNHLEPDSTPSAGEYELHYNFFGVEYQLFSDKAKLFIETRLEDSTSNEGVNNDDNQFALGLTVSF
jgi:predicted porin